MWYRYKYISDLHSVPACALASLSLMKVIPEWVPTLYSTSYMVVDGVVMTYRLSIGDEYGTMQLQLTDYSFGPFLAHFSAPYPHAPCDRF